jgi:hypothetical protein
LNYHFDCISFWIISKVMNAIFYESLARARKERQVARNALYRAGAGQADGIGLILNPVLEKKKAPSP